MAMLPGDYRGFPFGQVLTEPTDADLDRAEAEWMAAVAADKLPEEINRARCLMQEIWTALNCDEHGEIK